MKNISLLFIFFTLVNACQKTSVFCHRDKGEWTLQDDCFCETSFTEFGNESNAKEFFNGVKIGFIADSGIDSNAQKVLKLLKEENVDAIVHSGDLDYVDSSSAMENSINKVFSDDFPYFYTVGNHDLKIWDRYQRRNRDRLMNGEIYCIGNLGVKSSCWFKGIQIVSTGAGTLCNNHKEYLNDVLETSSIWKICSFHKVHSSFQLGSKTDEVELDIYQKCIDKGALIMTAHDHVYGRTYLMTDAFNKKIITKQPYIVKKGQSVIWINGLGGLSRFSEKSNNGDNPWWEKAYGRKTGSKYGALVCTFYYDKTDCYFKTIEDQILDDITLFTEKENECMPDCPECTKSWETPVPDGCGGFCPIDNCGQYERCSSSAGYTCVNDPSCAIRCIAQGCVQEDESQPTNWCGGTCKLPLC